MPQGHDICTLPKLVVSVENIVNLCSELFIFLKGLIVLGTESTLLLVGTSTVYYVSSVDVLTVSIVWTHS